MKTSRPGGAAGSGGSAGPADKGRVEVYTCASAGAEADHIADLLRHAHLRDGVPWSDMAVLVRSGRTTIPALSRALTAAGVPVEVAGDEIPLMSELAVRPLLTALGVAAASAGTGVGGPVRLQLTGDEARLLLTSPLGRLDSMDVRRLGRALRRAEGALLAGSGLARPSDELLRAALADPALLEELPPGREVAAARDLAALLGRVVAEIRSGGSAETTLWTLWSGTDWPQRLQTEASYGGDVGRRANRDLDAVLALFAVAARSEEMSGLRGVTGFLAEVEAQEIPADPRTEAELRGASVRVLTAHRSKGLEWPLVVVAAVQEGSWPDIRRRGSLLEADRLSRHGLAEPEPTAARIAEERRLFYVACTRARSRLIVTAVEGTEGEGDQPSRFLAELDVPVQRLPGRPDRPLSMPALVGELRRVSTDAEAAPALRIAAAERLARLADAVDDDDRHLVSGADPAHWWGMRALSDPERPVLAPATPVRLSGSQLASVLSCPRQWFLARRASAESVRNSAASFGTLVHVLAQHGADRGDGVPGAADGARLSDQLEAVWDQLDFDAAWLSDVERVEAETAFERFLTWQEAPARSDPAGHRGQLQHFGRAGPRADRVDRNRRPGRTRPRGPDPDRRLQDRAAGADRGRGRGPGSARRLPAGRPAGRVRRGDRRRSPLRRGRAGLSAAARRRDGDAEGLRAGLAGRRPVPGRRKRRPG